MNFVRPQSPCLTTKDPISLAAANKNLLKSKLQNTPPRATKRLLSAVLINRKVKVQEQVKAKGGHTKITTKYTTSNKETKIIVNSPWVKEHCLFKDNSVITDTEYKKALNFLCTYTMAGKNKNDDIPDGFAQLSEFAQSLEGNKVTVFKRPF